MVGDSAAAPVMTKRSSAQLVSNALEIVPAQVNPHLPKLLVHAHDVLEGIRLTALLDTLLNPVVDSFPALSEPR